MNKTEGDIVKKVKAAFFFLQHNVIAATASAVVNHRVHPSQSLEEVGLSFSSRLTSRN